jgi:diguanylate cyclase (GGDEF)-like protein/PAS domain S-box-containing protein
LRLLGPYGWLWLAGVIVAGGAAASLWFGAARAPERYRAGYRWLAAAALLWCVAGAGQQILSGQLNGFATPLTLADLFPLLALAPMVAGILTLAGPPASAADDAQTAAKAPVTPEAAGTGRVSGPIPIVRIAPSAAPDTAARSRAPTSALSFSREPRRESLQFWGYLADSYVMAAGLFVVGWLVIFGTQYHKTGEDPRTFLLGLTRPLAGILVVSALLPLVAAAGRRAVLPYLALIAVMVGDAFGAALRLAGGHEPGGAEQIAKIVGYVLLGAAPWAANHWVSLSRGGDGKRGEIGSARLPTPAIVSALAVAVAAVLIISDEVTGGSQVDPVVVFAASGAVVALAIRVLGLLRENELAVAAAQASGGHVRELADRTSDVVLICDLDGTIRYSSPSVAAYGYAIGNMEGHNLAEFVHPEDRPAGQRAIRQISESGGDRADGIAAAGEQTGGDRGRAGRYRGDAAANGHAALNGRSRGLAEAGGDDRGDEDGDTGDAASHGSDAGTEAGTARFPCRVLAADGTWRHIEAAVSRYHQPGEREQLLVTARDVSDQVALRQQVTHLTFHDRLTGLPNRVYFEERVADVLGRGDDRPGYDDRRMAGRAGEPGQPVPGGQGKPTAGARAAGEPSEEFAGVQVAAVFLHLDGFTAATDSAGHAAGDLLVTQAARRMREAVPAQHTLARWGDDEFAILVEARAGAKEVVDLAEQLARCVSAEPFSVSGRGIALTASVGVALAGDSTARDLLRNADVAMSRAKSLGGGLVEIFAAHMHADIVRRLELTSDLQRAVSDGRLDVEFQPIVELATSRFVGVEALVRWWRGDESVPPAEFLGIAEESGLIVPIGDWVLREACGQVAQWRRFAWDIGVSVNFSGRQIGAPGFVESVLAALANAELPPSALTVEVAEQVLQAHRGETAGRLSDLRRHGVRIAIEDFGTGYASLGNLRQLPVDVIKVDPSFVSGVGTDEKLTLLTRTVVRLGRDLDLIVVAEGIERPGQLELLREMGCARGQGHLVGHPASAAAMESMIRASYAGFGQDVTEQGKTPAPAS